MNLDPSVGREAVDEFTGTILVTGDKRFSFSLAHEPVIRLDPELTPEVIPDGLGPPLGKVAIVVAGSDSISLASQLNARFIAQGTDHVGNMIQFEGFIPGNRRAVESKTDRCRAE